MIINKRGELTSSQLIAIIILIISFVVILIFLFLLNPKSTINSETCKESVALRASTFGTNVKLDCKTQNTCISASSSCDNYRSDQSASVLQAATKQQVMDQLADVLYNCWWMMGEGKIDYAPQGYGFGGEQYCAICNNIKFDKSVRNNPQLNQISLKEFYQYLANKKTPDGKQSYLSYLLGVNSLDGARNSILENSKKEGVEYDLYSQYLDLSDNQEYIVLTGVSKQGRGTSLVLGGVVATAGVALAVAALPAGVISFGGIVSAYKSLTTIAALGGTAAKWGAAGTWVGLFVTNGDKQYLSPMIYPYNGSTLDRLNCKEFTSLS